MLSSIVFAGAFCTNPFAHGNWAPRGIVSLISAQWRWGLELIAKLALDGSERVLDAGCGDGKLSAAIARRVPAGSVVGLDQASSMIELASERFARVDNLSFVCLDLRDAAFEAEFSRVFSCAALHWIRDHRPALAAIARSLQSGGRAVLQMGGRGNTAEILAVVDELRSEPTWRPYFDDFEFPWGFHGSDEYRRWLKGAGLTPRRVELRRVDMTHAGADGLAGWLRSTWMPYVHRVPAARREAFITAIVRRHTERRPIDGDGRSHVDMVRLEVEAERPASPPGGPPR